MRDWFSRHFADPVRAELDAFQRLIDFVKRILFLGKKAERKIAIVGIASGVGLVHPKGGRFASLRAGAEIVFRDSSHRIDHRVAQLEQLLFLGAGERIEPFRFVVLARTKSVRRSRCVASLERFVGSHVLCLRGLLGRLFLGLGSLLGCLAVFARAAGAFDVAGFFLCAFGLTGFFEAFFFGELAIISSVALGSPGASGGLIKGICPGGARRDLPVKNEQSSARALPGSILRARAGIMAEGKTPEDPREAKRNRPGEDQVKHQPSRVPERFDEEARRNIRHDHHRDDPSENETE